ncbi:MAG: DUF559 domain-containing protein [Solirubrobacterales bacterium]|nr:DUF559 domain-containing protein [Solirubrobacterales bacterium]
MATWLRRHDAVRTEQLLTIGFSERQIGHLVAHGNLKRQYHGVYVDGHSPVSPRGQLRAALLAVPGAFLSHRTGAAVRGYRALNTREIHLTVARAHTPRIKGLRIHRTGHEPSEVSVVAGMRVATLPLLLLQFAASGDRDLEALITAAARKQTLDPMALERFLHDHRGQPGCAALRQALDYYRPAPAGNSTLERDVHAWLAEHPEIPRPDETNVRIGPYEWDVLWHERRVSLEIDGRDWHSAMQDKERDALKDAYIQRRGYRVIRLTGHRFQHDRAGFHDDLMALLAPPKTAVSAQA